jgi:hypothetical protein
VDRSARLRYLTETEMRKKHLSDHGLFQNNTFYTACEYLTDRPLCQKKGGRNDQILKQGLKSNSHPMEHGYYWSHGTLKGAISGFMIMERFPMFQQRLRSRLNTKSMKLSTVTIKRKRSGNTSNIHHSARAENLGGKTVED